MHYHAIPTWDGVFFGWIGLRPNRDLWLIAGASVALAMSLRHDLDSASPENLEPPSLTLELNLQKKQEGSRSLVEIVVVLRPTRNRVADAALREGFGQRLCRELRAYLMIGR